MAEFFGDLERTLADLYPWRWPIGIGFFIVIAGILAYGYYRGWHRWIRRHSLPIGLAGAPLLALVGFLAYDLGTPLFTNKTVEEEFPFSFAAAVPEGMSREEVEEAMAVMAQVTQPMVEEAMPVDMMMLPTSPTPQPSETPTPTNTPVPPSSPEPSGPEAVKLKSGEFQDQDSFHKGSGEATIYEGPDGSLLLRLETLDVTNGPDLHVFLSPHSDPEDSRDVKSPGYVDLGKLKGNRGNQNYPIPDDVNLDEQNSVVIYCVPFSVIFSVAMLEDTA